ncbi:aminoglycoside phosphotransferase family protein [Paenibacillus glycanilyticus]|uniref:phosphotransferase enzyme family protein n=1 Tax=Paenibacillus glycanilyticus TaxID=126569 RepID=UPI00203AC52E|nr:aminoglycoside phosphotransferase family protein [Paenibacillus glycanilyticus]MCM3626642.1 aminoglycoside phosphotransferase family protein [Paenibacillus glycanilyticus]
MGEGQYNLRFEELCKLLQLGEMVRTPEAVTGGLLHRMYAIETTQGKYAVKALNPQVMTRPKAKLNFIHSEQIANRAANHVPAIPAMQFKGNSLQQMDSQYYLVFDWVEGKSLKPDEINKIHCEKIGAILADIHMADLSGLGLAKDGLGDVQPIDWKHYLQQGQLNKAAWVPILLETADQLCDWHAKANKAVKLLEHDTVISHLDLDSKNVLWNHDQPILIDWEASGPINPMQSLTETAIYWSETETGNIDKERFSAFVRGYRKKYGPIQADWKTVLATGFAGMLGWLDYNLKRSLWMECSDDKEQRMGTEQVAITLNAIKRYADRISEIEQWLHAESR